MDSMASSMDNDGSQQGFDSMAAGPSGASEDRMGGSSCKSGSGSGGQPKFSNGPDVQSLHNRLLVVEGTLSQLSTTGPTSSLSSALSSIPPFKSSYPGSSFTQALPSQGSSGGYINNTYGGTALAGLPCNDRALLAIGASGSSVVINLEDVASIWINELDLSLNAESPPSQGSACPPFTSGGLRPSPSATGKAKVKLEPSPVALPPSPSSINGYGSNASTPGGPSSSAGQGPTFIAPLPFSTFLPNATPTSDPSSSRSYVSELPQVTTALLQHLPATPLSRGHLIRVLSDTMALHPCFNVRHFEHRIEAMMAYSDSPTDSADEGRPKNRELARELFLGIPPSRKRKPTLSFFAAAAAAFALGALVANEAGDSGGSPGPPGSIPSPAALYALSEQALGLFEKTSSYDVDSLVAMILQVLYQLHEGQMRIAQGVFPMVAKMVNVARMMGLGMDPDEFPGTYSLFEAETRRRVWWDIYYYDTFISDCMGQAPLIAEGSFTTKLPADVDEQQFSPSSTTLTPPGEGEEGKGFAFFVLKCRLAQLVKSIRKQTAREPNADEGPELSLDQAATSESDVTTWLSELPARFHLDADPDGAPTPTPPPHSALAARPSGGGALPSAKPPHQVSGGTVNAARTIVSAARTLHGVWKSTRPAAFDFYDYGRSVFDAAVLCAHTVIQQPNYFLATPAMDVVTSALEILKDLSGAREDAGPNDAWKIVEMMRRKADAARTSGSCSDDAAPGNKRKRADSEETSFDEGLQLPFVGPSITSAKTDQARPMLAPSRPSIAIAKDVSASSSSQHKSSTDSAAKSSAEKEKEKKEKRYPPVGIRVRPGQSRPFNRQRTHSLSPNSPLVLNGGHAPSTPAPSLPQMEPTPIPPPTAVSDSSLNGFNSFHPSPPQVKENPPPPQPIQQQQDQYQLNDAQRYPHAFSSSSPPMGSVYDQSASANPFPGSNGEHTQPSYTAPPPADNFYAPYPQPGASGFDQGLSMPEYATTPVEQSVPNTPVEHSYLLPSDKHSGYAQHRGKPADAMGHEYHAPQQQSQQPMPMMVQGVQGWPNSAPMWDNMNYKYYNGVAG
ncbi:hypothetical protein EIP91_009814 [Steccherinum ochraceum]|uniref:Xylanolytic transcriptional activator regulatory domain-containing protein n=1 Tax=Steccherinum ochraceum TaxID=92696 RepID=A0A4R0RJI5_9APHY|nr:hypothetical protein EIP91_009814 [Steccherinum ochraceum]